MEFPAVLDRTYIDGGPRLLASLFMFGWLNVPAGSAAIFLTLIAFGLLFISGDEKASRLGLRLRLWLAASALTMPLLISLVAWLYWTPASMDSIPGLQGRYFIPLAPALLIAAIPGRASASPLARFVPMLMIGANAVALASIVSAFYAF
jgi:hypothetical protein